MQGGMDYPTVERDPGRSVGQIMVDFAGLVQRSFVVAIVRFSF